MNDNDLAWLIGQKVVEIDFLNPSLVFENGSLIIECPWRLRDEETTLLGFSEFKSERQLK